MREGERVLVYGEVCAKEDVWVKISERNLRVSNRRVICFRQYQ